MSDNFKNMEECAAYINETLKNPEDLAMDFEIAKKQLGMFDEDVQDDDTTIKARIQEFIKLEQDCRAEYDKHKMIDEEVARQFSIISKELKVAEQKQGLTVSKKQELGAILKKLYIEEEINERERYLQRCKMELETSNIKLRMYRYLSRVHWNKTAGSNYCEGYVTLKSDTKAFSMDKNQYSHFFIANNLWDLMDDE